LKADNGFYGRRGVHCWCHCDIIFRLTSFLIGQTWSDLLQDPLAVMIQITYKFGSTTLASSIRALSTLAHHFDAGDGGLFGKKLLQASRLHLLIRMSQG
jgi:hypothetical protein